MNRYFPAIVFVVTSVIGLGMTAVVHRSTEMSSETRFERLADEAVDRVKLRVGQHISLLRAARSFFEANSGIIDRSAFRTFISGLGTDEAYDGIQGIGFARLIKTGQESIAEEQVSRGYALARSVWPQTNEPVRAPIVLLEPTDTRNVAALAFDMFSEETRRIAMKQALQSDEPVASAPVELVQEITSDKQAGFLVYLRYGSATEVEQVMKGNIAMSGFVYAPFRAGDLHTAALSRKPLLPIVLETYDISGGTEVPLYRSPGYDELRSEQGDQLVKVTEIAGRSWKFVISSTHNSPHTTEKFIAPLLAVLTLLLAGALAATTQAQFRAMGAARQLNELNQTALQQKELMLQET